ncbi:hypothetical protein [Vibrio sp. HN007]|uniref:hypothetical protein n=1 Tax=Vibrio iocasae TaxID=3098914 RepID=UPI0035D463F8
MKLTQVYMTLEELEYEPLVRARYQYVANYLTLFVSDWLKELKLDLGTFNRFVFQEGYHEDMSIVGDKAFRICVKPEFTSMEKFTSSEFTHCYFVRKYLEGFSKIDQKFGLNLEDELRQKMKLKFEGGYKYDAKAKSKKVGKVIVQLLHRYQFDRYKLVFQCIDHCKNVQDEKVIFESEPDPFTVHFDINKIEIDEHKVRVFNKIRQEHLLVEL